MEAMVGLEVGGGRPLLARRELIIGWTGEVTPHAPSMSEAPSGQRGLISFTGDGTLFVSSR
jgi:hypothetical protein